MLQEDEFYQWQYVRSMYKKLDATGDTFPGWDHEMKDMWKYSIAFTAYGLPSLLMIKPEWKDEILYYFSILIEKMKSEHVWGDWRSYGFGHDPLSKHNIMYKGHLNLMLGLYQLISGDQRYEQEFIWLTNKIVTEIRNSREKSYQGVTCEPNQYFAHCNAIGLLSLKIHDLIFGSKFGEDEVKDALSFINGPMRDPITGLYWESFHPSHGAVIRELSAYTNAWAISILHPLDPQYYEKLYKEWKNQFVVELGPFAVVKEYSYGGASRIATLFGLFAAKEFNDSGLFKKLKHTIDTFGFLTKDTETGQMQYLFADNTLLNGMTFAFKVHVGFSNILEAKWPARASSHNSLSNLSWQEILERKDRL